MSLSSVRSRRPRLAKISRSRVSASLVMRDVVLKDGGVLPELSARTGRYEPIERESAPGGQRQDYADDQECDADDQGRKRLRADDDGERLHQGSEQTKEPTTANTAAPAIAASRRSGAGYFPSSPAEQVDLAPQDVTGPTKRLAK